MAPLLQHQLKPAWSPYRIDAVEESRPLSSMIDAGIDGTDLGSTTILGVYLEERRNDASGTSQKHEQICPEA
jgi:hypothetical protein